MGIVGPGLLLLELGLGGLVVEEDGVGIGRGRFHGDNVVLQFPCFLGHAGRDEGVGFHSSKIKKARNSPTSSLHFSSHSLSPCYMCTVYPYSSICVRKSGLSNVRKSGYGLPTWAKMGIACIHRPNPEVSSDWPIQFSNDVVSSISSFRSYKATSFLVYFANIGSNCEPVRFTINELFFCNSREHLILSLKQGVKNNI